MKKGSLTVVGTGIQCPGQLTLEAKSFIQSADKVFFLVTEPVAHRYIERLNKNSEDLYKLYSIGKPRIHTYNQMIEKILCEVRKGKQVCAAFYGHPGVFVYPSHASIRSARQEGYPATMLPATSAEDSLFADLGIDPGMGCQSYEATAFLLGGIRPDTLSILILWQIGAVGDMTFTPNNPDVPKRLQILSDYLQRFYPPDQRAIIYEATTYPVCKPRIDFIPLNSLGATRVTGVSTLCILPSQSRKIDEKMVKALGIDAGHLKATIRGHARGVRARVPSKRERSSSKSVPSGM